MRIGHCYIFNGRKEGGVNTLKSWTGPEAIEQYLSADTKGRLIQSLKSFLSSRNLQSTEVFGRRYSLEDLIARILRDLREMAEHQFGINIKSAVVGRPVHFVGAEKAEDDIYAEGRLRSAFEAAGYRSVVFEMECSSGTLLRVHARSRRTHPDWRFRRRHERLLIGSRWPGRSSNRHGVGQHYWQRRSRHSGRCF